MGKNSSLRMREGNYIDNTVIWVVGAGLVTCIVGSIIQLRSDIARINVTLNKIAKQVGVPDTVTNELKILISEGKKIKAIKKYRMVTGLGLLEAKQYVDSLSDKIQPKSIFSANALMRSLLVKSISLKKKFNLFCHSFSYSVI